MTCQVLFNDLKFDDKDSIMSIFVLYKVMYILGVIFILNMLCFIYLTQRSTSFGRFDTFRNQHSPSRLEENGTPEVRRIWMNKTL